VFGGDFHAISRAILAIGNDFNFEAF